MSFFYSYLTIDTFFCNCNFDLYKLYSNDIQ